MPLPGRIGPSTEGVGTESLAAAAEVLPSDAGARTTDDKKPTIAVPSRQRVPRDSLIRTGSSPGSERPVAESANTDVLRQQMVDEAGGSAARLGHSAWRTVSVQVC